MSDEPAWLKVPEIAALLRCSKMTVIRMIQDGALSAIRLSAGSGSSYRVPRGALAEYLADAWVGDAPEGLRTEDLLGEPGEPAEVVSLPERRRS